MFLQLVVCSSQRISIGFPEAENGANLEGTASEPETLCEIFKKTAFPSNKLRAWLKQSREGKACENCELRELRQVLAGFREETPFVYSAYRQKVANR
jgi:hypothetical protein